LIVDPADSSESLGLLAERPVTSLAELGRRAAQSDGLTDPTPEQCRHYGLYEVARSEVARQTGAASSARNLSKEGVQGLIRRALFDVNEKEGDPKLDTLDGFDLRLMSWRNGSEVPISGRKLVIVGTDDGLLHICIFNVHGERTDTFERKDSGGDLHLLSDASGKVLWDVSESELAATQAGVISTLGNLKNQIQGLRPEQGLNISERGRVLGQVRSIVDQTPLDLGFARICNFLADHLDDSTEEFNKSFYKNEMIGELAKSKKSPGGKLDRTVLTKALLYWGWQAHEYVAYNLALQMEAFSNSLMVPLDERERLAFDQMHLPHDYLGGLNLHLLAERLSFAEVAVRKLVENPGDRDNISVLHQMLSYYPILALGRRMAERRSKARPGRTGTLVYALDEERDSGGAEPSQRSGGPSLGEEDDDRDSGAAEPSRRSGGPSLGEEDDDRDSGAAEPSRRSGGPSLGEEDDDRDSGGAEPSRRSGGPSLDEEDDDRDSGAAEPSRRSGGGTLEAPVAAALARECGARCNCPSEGSAEWIAAMNDKAELSQPGVTVKVRLACMRCRYGEMVELERGTFFDICNK
jgi:hypothetical protein